MVRHGECGDQKRQSRRNDRRCHRRTAVAPPGQQPSRLRRYSIGREKWRRGFAVRRGKRNIAVASRDAAVRFSKSDQGDGCRLRRDVELFFQKIDKVARLQESLVAEMTRGNAQAQPEPVLAERIDDDEPRRQRSSASRIAGILGTADQVRQRRSRVGIKSRALGRRPGAKRLTLQRRVGKKRPPIDRCCIFDLAGRVRLAQRAELTRINAHVIDPDQLGVDRQHIIG